MWGSSDFGGWYQASHPRVVAALTVAAGSAEVAEDATAEAFVRAYERWDRVRRMASPDGWLYRVALNLLRRRQRRWRSSATCSAGPCRCRPPPRRWHRRSGMRCAC